MAIIGNPIISTDFPRETFSGNGSTTAFTMSIAPASVNAVIVVVSGITQDPSTYTISGTTLTFSAAPPTGTSNISVRHLGVAGIPNTPSANSVGPSAINSSYSLWNLSGSDVNYTAGNVGIGTASPTARLTVQDATTGNGTIRYGSNPTYYGEIKLIYASDEFRIGAYGSSEVMTYYTAGSERMRIDSSGSLLVGTTDSSGTSGVGTKIVPSATAPNIRIVGSSASSGDGAIYMYSTGAGAFRFYIDYAGTIHATSTSISAISDATLKENVKVLETGLAEVLTLKPRRFDWINGDKKNVAGFIAQEVAEILPELVEESPYSMNEDGTTINKLNLKMGDILPTLVKAIQELNAKVDAQALEIQALKGTV